MPNERHLQQIVELLEEKTFHSYGRTAERVADGIERSGINEILNQSQYTTAEGFTGLAAALGMATEQISRELQEIDTTLRTITELSANPLGTAALERFRRGTHALERGWVDEAITEFTAAIEQDPFHPQSHAQLGLAFGAAKRTAEAAESFKLASRYATPDQPSVAVGGVLLAGNALVEIGKPEGAAELLSAVYKQFPSCAELGYALWRIGGDELHLDLALATAPELGALVPSRTGVRISDIANRIRSKVREIVDSTAGSATLAEIAPPADTERSVLDGELFAAARAAKFSDMITVPIRRNEAREQRIESARRNLGEAQRQVDQFQERKPVREPKVQAAVGSALASFWLVLLVLVAASCGGFAIVGVIRFAGDSAAYGGGLGNPLVLLFIAGLLGWGGYWVYVFWEDAHMEQDSSRRKVRVAADKNAASRQNVASARSSRDSAQRELETALADAPLPSSTVAQWRRLQSELDQLVRSVPPRLRPWQAPSPVKALGSN